MRGTFGAAMLVAMAALALTVGTAVAAPGGATSKPLWQASHDYYFNPVAPADSPATPDLKASDLKEHARKNAEAQKGHLGYPPAARTLARREALANKTGESPRTIARTKQGMPSVQHARMLVIPVEFDPEANDDFSGWERPNDPSDPDGCEVEPAGTLLSGPVHNLLPDPATVGTGRDNNTLLGAGLQPEPLQQDHLQQDRPDPEGPKGPQRGRDLRGRTVRNHYAEMSNGKYEVGGVSPWLMLPHSEAWYSADSCEAGPASDVGHPDNPRGDRPDGDRRREALCRGATDFPFADYDVEDQGDIDDDGNLYEPDGVLDHVVVLHAGADQADDGGDQGTYAEWSIQHRGRPGQRAATRSPGPASRSSTTPRSLKTLLLA